MKRRVSALLAEYLELFPCVALVGSRQCGKTTVLQNLGADWLHFDLEFGEHLSLVSQDPDGFLARHQHCKLAIDEAQRLPQLFPALRVAIDRHRGQPGRYVITGSSSPDLQQSFSESLAGRLAQISMSPFSLLECAQVSQSFFARFLESDRPPELPEACHRLQELVLEYWFEGGYPEPWLKNSGRFRKLWRDNFVRTYLERDLSPLFPGIDRNRFRTFLGLLASVSGTVLNLSDLGRTLAVSQPTVRDYLEIASGTFLWRRLYPYEKNVQKRIVKHPFGYLRDSGLVHFLLHIPSLQALQTHVVAGRSWQCLVTEEILRGLESSGIPFEAYYYRTAAGAEIDLVLDGEFGLTPVEIKYSSQLRASELRPIKTFMEEHQCVRGAVFYTGERLIQLDDRLWAFPVTAF